MAWQPLIKDDWAFKDKSEKQIIKEMTKQIMGVKKANGDPITGKHARKAAKYHYKSMLTEDVWVNNIYMVIINRKEWGDKWIHISIKRRDKEQINDPARWQHFQWIKNQLVGEEHEALELYPAESRMVNSANQYHLWVLKKPSPDAVIPCGWFDGRLIMDREKYGSKQTLEKK